MRQKGYRTHLATVGKDDAYPELELMSTAEIGISLSGNDSQDKVKSLPVLVQT